MSPLETSDMISYNSASICVTISLYTHFSHTALSGYREMLYEASIIHSGSTRHPKSDKVVSGSSVQLSLSIDLSISLTTFTAFVQSVCLRNSRSVVQCTTCLCTWQGADISYCSIPACVYILGTERQTECAYQSKKKG